MGTTLPRPGLEWRSWANLLVGELERNLTQIRQVPTNSFQGTEKYTNYWYNNQPLFRKCIPFPQEFLETNGYEIPHNIGPLNFLVSSEGRWFDGNEWNTFPYYNGSYWVSFSVTNTSIRSQVVGTKSWSSLLKSCIIIEYTKEG